MTILSLLIWNLLAPAAVASATVAAARRLGRGPQAGHRGRWGVAAGLGLGYFAGHVGLLRLPSFPAVDSLQWVAWLALAAAGLGIVEAARPIPRRVSWAARGLLVAGAIGLILRSQVEHHWTAAQAAPWLAGTWAVVMASWWNLEAQGERLPGPGWMFHLGLVAAGWAAVQVRSGNAAAGQLDGVLASAALGALPAVGLRPGPTLARGGPAVASMVLAGLGLTGYFYSEVPAAAALLLVLAPWAPWVDRIGLVRRRSPWTRASIRVLAVLIAVGAAVLVAEAGSRPSPDDVTGP